MEVFYYLEIKTRICSNLKNDLYEKYKEDLLDKKITKDSLLEEITQSYDKFIEDYCKKIDGDLRVYIEALIEDDMVEIFNLQEIIIEEISDIDENEGLYIASYDLRYENIEKTVRETVGPLTSEEKDILAAKNIPLVHSIVKRFSNTGIDYSELLSAGFVGYAKALDTFTKGKNVKFSTYAYRCIQNEILYFLRREKRHRDNDISLSRPISTDKNGNVMTVNSIVSTEDAGHKSLEQEVELNETVKILLDIIDEYLSETEAFIIRNRYGLDNKKPKTQKEIADEIGMSQANVSKLEKGINDKIKKIMSSKYKIKSI